MLSPESSPESAGGQSAQRRVSPSTVTQHGLPTPSNSFSNSSANRHARDGEGNIVPQTPGPQSNPTITLQPASAFRHKRTASQTEPEADDNQPTSSNTLAVPRTLGRKRSRLSDDGVDSPATPATQLALSFAASSIAASSLDVGWPQQLPTPTATPLRPPFNLLQNILDNSDLSLALAINLPIKQFIDLYAISKHFHWEVNSHLQGYIKAYIAHNAPDTAKIFKWSQYAKSTIYDPAVRPIGIHPAVPLAFRDRNRTIPALRWLQKVMHREHVANKIVSLLACEGLRLPHGTTTIIKKIWFLLEQPTCGQRAATLKDRKSWTDRDLLLATILFHKLDLRFTDPEHGKGEPALRTFLLTQKSLDPMLRVLEGYYSRKDKYTEFVNLILEAFYNEVRHAGMFDEDDEDDDNEDSECDSDENLDEIEDRLAFDLIDADEEAALALGEVTMEEHELAQLAHQGLEFAPQTAEENLAAGGVRPTQPLGTNAPLAMVQTPGPFTVMQHGQELAFPINQQPQAAGTAYGNVSVADFLAMEEDADFESDPDDDDADIALNPGHADPQLPQPTQPDPNTILDTHMTRFGALGREHWYRPCPPLASPDTMILYEAFAQGLNLQKFIVDSILWGNADPRDGGAIPPIRRAWLEGKDNRKYEDVEDLEADETTPPTPLERMGFSEGEGMDLDEEIDNNEMSGLENDY